MPRAFVQPGQPDLHASIETKAEMLKAKGIRNAIRCLSRRRAILINPRHFARVYLRG